MRASTQEYIRLQTMYKARAQEEKATFVGILRGLEGGDALAGQGEVWPLPFPCFLNWLLNLGRLGCGLLFEELSCA